jgi:HK97 family phage major capsid protein
MSEVSQHLEGLTTTQGEMLHTLEGLSADLEKDGADRVAIKAQLKTVSDELAVITEEKKKAEADAEATKLRSDMDDIKAQLRNPSFAKAIGAGRVPTKDTSGLGFFEALAYSRSTRDPSMQAMGKAALDAMGSTWSPGDPSSKATLGDTAGAGGNIVPPNVLSAIVEIATAINPYRQLLTVIDAGFVSGVDIPVEGLAPLRAVVAGYGATKANQAFTASKYSATMYTIARIFDVGNQLLRNSRGAAENLVQSELGRAFALGEAYYVLNGSGTSEPKGILTSIGTSGTFVSSFTASSTTLAGSSASAIAKASGVLANRARQADGAVCNASDFWIMMAQGTDSAGFFFAPAGGPTQIDPTKGYMRIWGIPVYADPNMPTDSMVVGQWKSAQLFTGQTYRVDVSDTAGTRWDTNETGFRGEEEIGFNADPYVVSGMFQRITDFTP